VKIVIIYFFDLLGLFILSGLDGIFITCVEYKIALILEMWSTTYIIPKTTNNNKNDATFSFIIS